MFRNWSSYFPSFNFSERSCLKNSSQLTKKGAITTRYISRKVAKIFLRIVVPEYKAILAEPFLGLSIDAAIIQIALFRIRVVALLLRTPELCLCPRHGHAQYKNNK